MDIYTIIFLALAVFILLRLRSVLGRRTGSERPFLVSAFAYRLSMIAAVLCAVHYVAYEAKWYSALEAARNPYHNHQRPRPRGRRRHRRRRGHILGNGTPLGGCAGLVFSALEGMEGPKTCLAGDTMVPSLPNTSTVSARGGGGVTAEEGQAARRAPA